MSTVQLRVVGRAIAITIIAVGADLADQVVAADATTITATLRNVFKLNPEIIKIPSGFCEMGFFNARPLRVLLILYFRKANN
jgi:hypothetical protein